MPRFLHRLSLENGKTLKTVTTKKWNQRHSQWIRYWEVENQEV